MTEFNPSEEDIEDELINIQQEHPVCLPRQLKCPQALEILFDRGWVRTISGPNLAYMLTDLGRMEWCYIILCRRQQRTGI